MASNNASIQALFQGHLLDRDGLPYASHAGPIGLIPVFSNNTSVPLFTGNEKFSPWQHGTFGEAPHENVAFPSGANITLAEILAFLPNSLSSKDVVARFTEADVYFDTITACITQHRKQNPKQQTFYTNKVLKNAQNMMRRHGPPFMMQIQGLPGSQWTYRNRKNFLQDSVSTTLDVTGFRTACDTQKNKGSRADPVPMKDLYLRGARKWPTGDEARDLTRVVQFAVSNPQLALFYPTHYHTILNSIGGPLPVLDCHLDKHYTARYKGDLKNQAQKYKTRKILYPKSKKGQAASASLPESGSSSAAGLSSAGVGQDISFANLYPQAVATFEDYEDEDYDHHDLSGIQNNPEFDASEHDIPTATEHYLTPHAPHRSPTPIGMSSKAAGKRKQQASRSSSDPRSKRKRPNHPVAAPNQNDDYMFSKDPKEEAYLASLLAKANEPNSGANSAASAPPAQSEKGKEPARFTKNQSNQKRAAPESEWSPSRHMKTSPLPLPTKANNLPPPKSPSTMVFPDQGLCYIHLYKDPEPFDTSADAEVIRWAKSQSVYFGNSYWTNSDDHWYEADAHRRQSLWVSNEKRKALDENFLDYELEQISTDVRVDLAFDTEPRTTTQLAPPVQQASVQSSPNHHDPIPSSFTPIDSLLPNQACSTGAGSSHLHMAPPVNAPTAYGTGQTQIGTVSYEKAVPVTISGTNTTVVDAPHYVNKPAIQNVTDQVMAGPSNVANNHALHTTRGSRSSSNHATFPLSKDHSRAGNVLRTSSHGSIQKPASRPKATKTAAGKHAARLTHGMSSLSSDSINPALAHVSNSYKNAHVQANPASTLHISGQYAAQNSVPCAMSGDHNIASHAAQGARGSHNSGNHGRVSISINQNRAGNARRTSDRGGVQKPTSRSKARVTNGASKYTAQFTYVVNNSWNDGSEPPGTYASAAYTATTVPPAPQQFDSGSGHRPNGNHGSLSNSMMETAASDLPPSLVGMVFPNHIQAPIMESMNTAHIPLQQPLPNSSNATNGLMQDVPFPDINTSELLLQQPLLEDHLPLGCMENTSFPNMAHFGDDSFGNFTTTIDDGLNPDEVFDFAGGLLVDPDWVSGNANDALYLPEFEGGGQ